MAFINKDKILYNLINIPGWRTKRKIAVFESDDWGSIRMPSRSVYEDLLRNGIRVDQFSYNRYDSLASEEDLAALFDVLTSVRDKNGHPAVLTANTIVANPDFHKIRESNYMEYHYEPFTETLKRYPAHARSFDLWKEGMDKGIFVPQLHGHGHVMAIQWLKALRQNKGKIRLAFDHQMFDLSESSRATENSFMQALNYDSKDELAFQRESVADGARLFEELFGYRSKTFIAPCYTWSHELDQTFHFQGVKAFQGTWYQLVPLSGGLHRFRKIIHYTGQRNKLGQYFLVRNAEFEPSQDPGKNWVREVVSQMETAFRWGKPAIIQTHRLNFIGFIDPSNRERNLPLFASLLKEIVNRWPDVEFMSSDQLLDLMTREKDAEVQSLN